MKRKESGSKRVLLVEDHPMMRMAMKMTIEQEPDLEVRGEADSVAVGLELLSNAEFDIAVVDISLQGADGIDLAKIIRKKNPDMPILMVSMHEDVEHVQDSLAAGANGYVSKHEEPQTMIEGIRAILRGETFIDQRLGSKVVAELSQERPKPVPEGEAPVLTRREATVLRLIVEGLSAKQVATKLGISFRTVEKHRENVASKLGVKRASDLVKFAIKNGLVPPDSP